MTVDVKSPAPERLAVADQVIISAGNILRVAGFRRDEIAMFFRQAADHLGAESSASSSPIVLTRKERFLQNLGSITPILALMELNVDTVSQGQAKGSLMDRFDLAMRTIPHIAAAQDWVRAAAAEAGLRIIAEEPEMSGGRAHADLIDAATAIGFDEIHPTYASGFAMVESVVGTLADQGDEEALNLILMSLVENSVVVSRELRFAIETAVERLGGLTGI